MYDEFSKNKIEEQTSYSEFIDYKDPITPEANPAAPEFMAYEEATNMEGVHPKEGINKKKKDQALATMSTGVVSAIAAVALGVTSMMNVNMTANFNKVEYLDGAIQYEVAVEKMTEKETLVATLYEGEEIVETFNLVDDDQDGLISGSILLDQDKIKSVTNKETDKLSYRLSLSGDVGLNVERKFDSYVVELENLTSVFESLSGECHCSEDGCYHFLMTFKDDLGIFKDFEAKIEDNFGNVSYCKFSDDLHAEQRIFVSALKGSRGVLTLTYTMNGEKQIIQRNIKM